MIFVHILMILNPFRKILSFPSAFLFDLFRKKIISSFDYRNYVFFLKELS